MVGPIICLVNRAPYPLTVTKNGTHTVLQPGENYVNADLVRFARSQHPIPGSQDPYTLQTEYLVGVKGGRDKTDALPQELLDLLPKEKLDRTKMPAALQRVTEKSVHFPRGRMGAAVENVTEGMIAPGHAPAGA